MPVHEIPGNHRTIFLPPNVAVLASILCEMMDGDLPRVDHATSVQPPQAFHAGR